jgi:hypothetical protein
VPLRPCGHALAADLLLDSEDLVAHPLERLRLALQPRDLLHLELLHVLGELVEDLLVRFLNLLLPVALLLLRRQWAGAGDVWGLRSG